MINRRDAEILNVFFNRRSRFSRSYETQNNLRVLCVSAVLINGLIML
jgi:hypothetical protein